MSLLTVEQQERVAAFCECHK